MFKQFTPFDSDITLVTKPCDIDPLDDDPNVLRAVLSCGHVAHPDSLTAYCRTLLENKQTELRCPVCNKVWSYNEIRKLAKLTAEEQQYFEETLGKHALQSLNIKNCPCCDTFIERMDSSNLCVECALCSKRKERIYDFCWQCEREWQGPQPRSDQCDNVGCANRDLELLRDCKMITLGSVRNIQCPSIRACPSCGVLIEHSGQDCKMILCFECNVEFCFLCLKPTVECLKTSTHFIICATGVRPRQMAKPCVSTRQVSQDLSLPNT